MVVGNWKMNKTPAEARVLAQSLAEDIGRVDGVEVVLCPPFTALSVVGEVVRNTNIKLGAQNMHFEKSGAFTGEVSGVFLKELGCAYVILGHSERRQLFGETDEMVRRKLRTALELQLIPIVCLGETREEREAGQTFERLTTQFEQSVAQAGSGSDVMVIAYEPIWAIGTGQNATPAQAAEVHRHIRNLAAREFGEGWAAALRILYGGSVTPENIDQLMAEKEIDGVLVGGASLKPSFARIVRFQAI
jgi:triosephosphate isomerase